MISVSCTICRLRSIFRLLPRNVCKFYPAPVVSAVARMVAVPEHIPSTGVAVAGTVAAPEDIPDSGTAVENPAAGGIVMAAHIVEARIAGSGVPGLYTHYNFGRTIYYIAG